MRKVLVDTKDLGFNTKEEVKAIVELLDTVEAVDIRFNDSTAEMRRLSEIVRQIEGKNIEMKFHAYKEFEGSPLTLELRKVGK